MYDNVNISVVTGANSVVVFVANAVAGPGVALPNSLMNAMLSGANAIGGPDTNLEIGLGEHTIPINVQTLDFTAKLLNAMMLGGMAVGVAVSVPVATSVAVAAIAAGAMANPQVREKVTDPDFWRDVGDWINRNVVDPSARAFAIPGYGFNPRPDIATNTRWRDALQPQPRDPLAIDLDGDGIETIGVPTTGSPVLFDHNANGVRTGTGWVRPDDAWLVRDLNGNGSIDSGRELFGVDTLITVTEPATQGAPARVVTRNATTGFEALRTLDTGSGTTGSAGHNDGRINSSDAAFANLRIWRDLNQDGISQPAELQTLPAAGIAAISLTVNTTPINLGNGNTVTGTATVTRSNGTTTLAETVSMQAGNLDLANNPFFREFTTAIPRAAAALALPEMGGSGLLRDLREAMSLGTPYAAKLVTAVQAFSAATTRTQQRALLGDVLAAWAETVPEANQWMRASQRAPVQVALAFTGVTASAMDANNSVKVRRSFSFWSPNRKRNSKVGPHFDVRRRQSTHKFKDMSKPSMNEKNAELVV